LFGYIILDYKSLPEFLRAADGHEWTSEKLSRIGLKITLLRYLFNRKAGINYRMNLFPRRALGNPPLDSGKTKGVTVNLNTMMDEYLKELGFDPNSNRPCREMLKEFGLGKYL
jgi:aldehyde:ferredoxin oxidoreductase